MGLKCNLHKREDDNTKQLKSDHFGIEIRRGVWYCQSINQLKSDHFGIEIKMLRSLSSRILLVKIRPFWDWNLSMPNVNHNLSLVKIRPFWDWNDDSETEDVSDDGLKSDHFGIEIN